LLEALGIFGAPWSRRRAREC